MKTLCRLFVVVSVMLLLASCGADVFYENIETIDKECWNKSDSVVCTFRIEDTTQYYTMYMDIRNSVDYRYQNLYVFMDTRDPKGTVNRDTLEFILADAFGNWKGRGDRIKDYQYFFYPKVRFPYKGEYRFVFHQAMREEQLTGIANFGMTVKLFDEDRFRKEMEKRRKFAEKAATE